MRPRQKTESSAEARSERPDLLHNYGKLAIPAVVAAVMPDNTASRRHATAAETQAKRG